MLKKFILLLSILSIVLPVFAGKFEESVKNGSNVFLYLYTPDCKLCNAFSKSYEQLSKEYNGKYVFYNVNANTSYGHSLMKKYHGRYVPFVVLVNKDKFFRIDPACAVDRICLEAEMKQFRK